MSLSAILSKSRTAVYGVAAALLVMWLGGFFDKNGKLVRVYQTQGVIEQVYEKAYLVRLEDGRKANVRREMELEKDTPVLVNISLYDSHKERAVVVGKVE